LKIFSGLKRSAVPRSILFRKLLSKCVCYRFLA